MQDDPGRILSATQCANCGTTSTPLWRRAPNGNTICNACGLFLKARNTPRPVLFQSAKDAGTGSCPGDGHCNGTGGSASCAGCPAYNQHQGKPVHCSNCQTTTTPLWRRDPAGNTICNACGLYYKLHNMHRPISMKRNTIKRRKRAAPPAPTDSADDESPTELDADDLDRRVAELDDVLARLQRLRQEALPRDKLMALVDMTDSLRDIVAKAELSLLT